jgi:hypothetical protein
MKIKTMGMTAVLAAGAALLGANAIAATTTPAANETHAHCEQQGKDKKLSGSALKDFVKKCKAEAAKK